MENHQEDGLPGWLAARPASLPPPRRVRRQNRWAERTVRELSGAARELATGERWAREDGFLQRRDARAKWLAALCLLVTVGLLRHPAAAAAACAVPPLLAALSRVPPAALLRRAWGAGLFFGTFVALPASALGGAGWEGGARFVLRVAASVSFALLLVLTTRWRDLMAGLRGLGVPPVFVSVLERTYRHLFQLPLAAEEMFQARRARTVGRPAGGEARRFVGFSLGALLGKAHGLAEATHDAMRARGYLTGVPPGAARPCWAWGDSLLVLLALAVALALAGGERALGG